MHNALILLCALALYGCGGGGGSDNNLGAPENLSASRGDTWVELTWTADARATDHHVYLASEPNLDSGIYANYADGEWLQNVGNPPYIVRNLNNDTTYYFIVTSVRNNKESEPGNEASATPIDQYELLESGSVVKDRFTNLEWQRCTYGATWDSGAESCAGAAAAVTWLDAQSLTEEPGWRVPTRAEAQSLVLCSNQIPTVINFLGTYGEGCPEGHTSPTINTDFFPNTTWELDDGGPSSIYFAVDAEEGENIASLIHFGIGEILTAEYVSDSLLARIRLVRPAP